MHSWRAGHAFVAGRAHAQVNEHMIAVNEAIGYTVYGQQVTGYRLDAAAVSG
jgi:hypothetical protein